VTPGAPPQTARRPPSRINTLNTWLKAYAAAHKHVYLDYFSAMVDDQGMLRAELSEDDLHPNARGYAIMSPLAEAAIAQAMR
jgi:lysophospholipase L1-like esterase